MGLTSSDVNYLKNLDGNDVLLSNPVLETLQTATDDVANDEAGLIEIPVASYSGDLRQQFSEITVPNSIQLDNLRTENHFVQAASQKNIVGLFQQEDIQPTLTMVSTNSIGLTGDVTNNTNLPSTLPGGIIVPEGKSNGYEVTSLYPVESLQFIDLNDLQKNQGEGNVLMQVPVNVKSPTTDGNAVYYLSLATEDNEVVNQAPKHPAKEVPVELDLDTSMKITEPQRSSTPNAMEDPSTFNETILAGNVDDVKSNARENGGMINQNKSGGTNVEKTENNEVETHVQHNTYKTVENYQKSHDKNEVEVETQPQPKTKKTNKFNFSPVQTAHLKNSIHQIQIPEGIPVKSHEEIPKEKSHNKTYCQEWVTKANAGINLTLNLSDASAQSDLPRSSVSSLLDVTSVSRNVPEYKGSSEKFVSKGKDLRKSLQTPNEKSKKKSTENM